MPKVKKERKHWKKGCWCKKAINAKYCGKCIHRETPTESCNCQQDRHCKLQEEYITHQLRAEQAKLTVSQFTSRDIHHKSLMFCWCQDFSLRWAELGALKMQLCTQCCHCFNNDIQCNCLQTCRDRWRLSNPAYCYECKQHACCCNICQDHVKLDCKLCNYYCTACYKLKSCCCCRDCGHSVCICLPESCDCMFYPVGIIKRP